MRYLSKFIATSVFIFAICTSSVFADITGGIHYLIESATAPVVGDTSPHVTSSIKTIEASLTGTGVVTASVKVEATNIRNNTGKWITLFEADLTGTNSASFGMVTNAPWQYYRAEVISITGTSSVCNVVLGT